LILRSRLQESALREREIQEKNRQLEREIQERIEVEESLRESEKRTRQLLDMESDVILMVDNATGEILDVNRAASDLYGYSRNELLKLNIVNLSSEPEKTSLTLLERPSRVPLRWHRRKDGSVFPVEIAIRYFQWHGRDVHVSGIRDITERLRDRETIEAQSEFLRQVLDSSPNLIFVEDVEGRLVMANRTFCDFFRKSYDDLRDKIPLEYIPGGDVAKLMYQDDLDILEGRIHRVERELAIPDHSGVDHWFHLVKSPMRDKRGAIDRIVCVCSDITNRKKAEQARAESEVRYRGLYHNAIVGLYRTAIEDGRILECNRRMAEIFGYKDRGHFMMEYTFADKYVDPEKRRILLMRLQSEGEVNGYVADMYHRDGSVIWLRYTAKLFPAEGYLEGFAIDITAQKAAEDALSRLGAAVEQAAEIIIMTDVQGTIQYVNPAFERITGYSRNEAIGKKPSLLKSGKHSQEFYRGLWDTILTGEVWKGRLTNRRKDGTLFEEEASISPIRDEKGRIINFVAVKRDVTREAALEDQLRQAQKMEAVGQLAGGVAHDFNNLLQAIMGHAQLALGDLKSDSGLSRDLEQVVSAAQKAASLTSQLLAFSRRQVLQPKPINLGSRVENLTPMLGRLLGQHIEIRTLNDPGLGNVKADPGQMEQILMNLAVNARDAMPEGGTLTIETRNCTLDEDFCDSHPWARPGDFVLLTVTDTGVGIPSHLLEHIFEPFFTTKEVGKGTGLGLATVYGIVKQHEGLIDVDSKPGKGSIFRIYIPRCDDAAVPGEVNGRNEPPQGSETILIVEDDSQVRNLAVRILGKGGYRVIQAVDGEEGLRVFQEKGDSIDLVLLDIVMPKMNGKALFERIREISPRKPVLFSSGYSSHILNTALAPEGDFQMIQKPYRPDDLLRRVRKVLDGGKDWESSADAET
jgi:PAS domain S-box-containing protein